MTKTFMALCLSATLALGGFTAKPAYAADGQDVATAVLGFLALYAIARELDDDNDKKTKSTKTHRHNGYTHTHHYKGAHRHKVPHYNQPRRHPRSLPANCIRNNPYSDGPSRFVTQRCLNKKGFTKKLPKQCRFTYQGRNRDLRAYGARCLRHKGYRLEARR